MPLVWYPPPCVLTTTSSGTKVTPASVLASGASAIWPSEGASSPHAVPAASATATATLPSRLKILLLNFCSRSCHDEFPSHQGSALPSASTVWSTLTACISGRGTQSLPPVWPRGNHPLLSAFCGPFCCSDADFSASSITPKRASSVGLVRSE